MEPLFVVAKIIGLHGKNDSLIVHSRLFPLRPVRAKILAQRFSSTLNHNSPAD